MYKIARYIGAIAFSDHYSYNTVVLNSGLWRLRRGEELCANFQSPLFYTLGSALNFLLNSLVC